MLVIAYVFTRHYLLINTIIIIVVILLFHRLVYVSNTCAQGMVTHGNITVKNGVVHIVDGLLGYVYSDAITQLHDQRQYQ